MKLIVKKWNARTRAFEPFKDREVAVKTTPRRIEITEGMNRGMRFDHDGNCLSKVELSSWYRYSLEVKPNS